MKTTHILFRSFVLMLLFFIAPNVYAQSAFTSGNLVVLNVNSATSSSLIEYTINGSVVQTINVPSTGSNALTISPSAGSEGALSRSANGLFLGFAGYRTGTNASGTDRVIARVEANGIINTSSSIPNAEGFTTNNIRGGVFSDDGLRYWAAGTGSGGGIRTNLFGTTSGSTQVSTTIANARTVTNINGQLYCSAASNTVQSVATVGTGLPTTSGNVISVLPGLPTTSGASAYAFAISPGAIGNGSVLYIADDRANALGGIQKWVYNAGTWSLIYTLSTGVANIGARGIAVNFSGLNMATSFGSVLYATTAEASLNRIIKIIDNGSSSIASTIATAPASNIFKGIAFSPVSNLPPVVSSSTATATIGTSYSYTITATNNPTSYSVSGLPSGLSLNTLTGVISGIPTTTGISIITLNATNANGSGSGTLTLNVCGIFSSSTQSNVLCNGSNTGSATVISTGGVMPYSYTWLPIGGSSSTASSLPAGTYTVSVADANACTSSHIVTISQPSPLIAIGTQNNVTCAGFCDGAVSILANGGTPPYTYVWSAAGYFSPIVTNLCSGNYTVTATDLNGCTTNFSATIQQPAPLSATKNQTPILCNGGVSSLTLSGSGGTPPYQYAVPPYPLQYASAYNLTAGIYSFYLIDAHSCFYQDTVTISEPPILMPSVTYSPILCTGGNTTLTVSASGGSGLYLFKLDGGPYQSSNSFLVNAGLYTITVKDAHQCTATLSIYIADPIPLSISASATPISCTNGTSQISVSATGGTGALQYQLNAGTFSPTNSFSVNTPGLYTMTARDSNFCTVQTTVNVIAPSGILLSEVHTNPICFGGSGTVNITATGGTPPYTGIGLFTQTAAPVTYLITDSNGCAAAISVSLNQPNLPLVTASFIPSVFCYGASVIPIASGLANYTWSGGLINANPFAVLASGTYTISGTDVNGCPGSTTIFLNAPAPSSQLSLAFAGNSATLNTGSSASGTNNQFDASNLLYTDTACGLISNIIDVPGGNILGNTTVVVHTEASLQTYNTQPYLRRWYQATSTNVANAIITLYLTQDDFDDYNAGNGIFPNLPQSGNNNDPYIANIRVTKIQGGALGIGNASIILPTVHWNNNANYWEVSFPDSVLGSYYIHAANLANAVLPVTLIDFFGVKSNGIHQFTWIVAQESQCQDYQLQSSSDAVHFTTVAIIPSQGHSKSTDTIQYHAINTAIKSGHNYYRILQRDIDGHYSYLSKPLDLFEDDKLLSLYSYPNPAEQEIVIECTIDKIIDATIMVTDIQGNIVHQANSRLSNGLNKFGMNVSTWAQGIYSLALYENGLLKGVTRISKR